MTIHALSDLVANATTKAHRTAALFGPINMRASLVIALAPKPIVAMTLGMLRASMLESIMIDISAGMLKALIYAMIHNLT